MSEIFLTILLISGFIAVIILIEVIILVIPLRISLSFLSDESETKGILTSSWLIFGIEMIVSGKDPQTSVMVGGTRLITRSASTFRAATQKHDRSSRLNRISDIFSTLLALQGPVLDAVLDLIRHTRFDYARGTARIGLGDPSATGMLYGLYWAVKPLLPINRITLNMVPEFNHEVYEFEINTRFHITYPIRIIVNAIKVAKHPAVWKVMKTMRKKPTDVVV